jgi:predicted Rossmann-fold nucleotide-binding protein
MSIRKPWDHAIDLKEIFKPKKGRLIPLSPEEQKEVSNFIDDQLSKKYIRPSKLEEVRIATDADIIIDTIKDILYDLKEPDLIP